MKNKQTNKQKKNKKTQGLQKMILFVEIIAYVKRFGF